MKQSDYVKNMARRAKKRGISLEIATKGMKGQFIGIFTDEYNRYKPRTKR